MAVCIFSQKEAHSSRRLADARRRRRCSGTWWLRSHVPQRRSGANRRQRTHFFSVSQPILILKWRGFPIIPENIRDLADAAGAERPDRGGCMRQVLLTLMACCLASAWSIQPWRATLASYIPGTPPAIETPDSKTLQDADLLWPRPKNAIVLYSSQGISTSAEDRKAWERDRNAYLNQLARDEQTSTLERERFRLLRSMTYERFTHIYLSDVDPIGPEPLSMRMPRVGHVAMVHMIDGVPWVVEALPNKGVRSLSYTNWLEERDGQLVWHGRLAGATRQTRREVATKATSFVGRPYNFWNFDLADEKSFYCSKLVWLAVTSVTKRAPDGNEEPVRRLWYSPRQLMKSPHIEIVFSPKNETF